LINWPIFSMNDVKLAGAHPRLFNDPMTAIVFQHSKLILIGVAKEYENIKNWPLYGWACFGESKGLSSYFDLVCRGLAVMAGSAICRGGR
jgi:hypothetical protein